MSLLKTKDQRIKELEAWKIEAQKTINDQRFKISDLNKRVETAGAILVNLQPVLGRLIAVGVVLERKGLYNATDLNAVENEAADSFVATAHPEFAEKVRSESGQTGTVASRVRDRNTGVSGIESARGTGPSDSVVENGKRAIITRLSDVRAAHGASNGTPDVGPVETENVSGGRTTEPDSGDGNADRP